MAATGRCWRNGKDKAEMDFSTEKRCIDGWKIVGN